jgi:hypothetical protein
MYLALSEERCGFNGIRQLATMLKRMCGVTPVHEKLRIHGLETVDHLFIYWHSLFVFGTLSRGGLASPLFIRGNGRVSISMLGGT